MTDERMTVGSKWWSGGATIMLVVGLAASSMGVRRCERVVVGDACKTKDGAASADCEPNRPNPGTCEYDGNHYESGDSFPASDGCNTCQCGDNGSVGCTKIGCPTADFCGGLTGKACAEGDKQFCNYPKEAQCGAADQTGVCTDIPEVCADIYAPVCGCDDKTYGNACEAAAASTSIVSEGECGAAGAGKGCKLGDTEFPVGASVICADGCNQCKCDGEDSWQSTLIGCEPPKVEACDGPMESSPGLQITPIYRADDSLALAVQYGGGCFDHTFKLCYSEAFAESSPVQTRLWLIDESTQVDACLALPTRELVFDLSPIREKYVSLYPGGPNTVVLNLGKSAVDYSF